MPKRNIPAVISAAGTLINETKRLVTVEKKNPTSSTRRSRSGRSKITRGRVSEYLNKSGLSSARRMAEVAGSASTRVLPAPVSAGMMMRGVSYQFGAAPVLNGQSGVRLSGRQIWASVNPATNGLTQVILLPWNSSAGVSNARGFLTFDPDDTLTMPPPLTSLASVFNRYCLRSCRVVFTPSANTADTHSVAFFVSTDAATGGASQSFVNLLQNSNTSAGPVWSMQSIDVPCDDTLRYLQQSTTDATLTAPEERQVHAFVLYAAASSMLSASVTYGYIHLEYTIDLYEVISGTTQSSLRRAEQRVEVMRQQLAAAPVEPGASHVREEKKGPSSTSLEASPQEELSGGWIRAPLLREQSGPVTTLTRESQAAGSVRSRSSKA